MCGIFGIIAGKKCRLEPDRLNAVVQELFLLSESRGKEAAGLMAVNGNRISIYKEPVPAHRFIRTNTYRQLMENLRSRRSDLQWSVIIGHSRLATNGLQTDNRNNQPVVSGSMVGVHNGIVVNDTALWKRLRKQPRYEVDTEAVMAYLDANYLSGGFAAAAAGTFAALEGSASLAVLTEYEPTLLLATNTGSLYAVEQTEEGVFFFASERYIAERILASQFDIGKPAMQDHIRHIPAGQAGLISFESAVFAPFTLSRTKKTKPAGKRVFSITAVGNPDARADAGTLRLYSRLNDIRKIRRHDFDYRAIYALKRCTRCILPETTPFISFDRDGVCNYCREHTPIAYKGIDALKRLVEPYRSRNGEPDCLIAFSGGRDSSYGLHFLKRELGMHPIAYTYDWGMVTDLARQNEARMVGALGIEHIIVSADITMKRDHIRKHILAWMKKPDLGMVPLFMEGDKQCEYYMDDLGKKTGIALKFFCRGNEFEKEEFKTGHCGVKNADPGGVIHNLSTGGKLKMAAYYAGQYITNPAYINSSIFDTAFAYFSTYIQKHDYIFLWHYIPWNEKQIVSTLTKRYGWQRSPETGATWRTDDGTSAFYNYIYYMGQGFTENDSFRARQIREGRLTRKQALQLVNQENKPRHEALKWYFDRIGLDGDAVLTVIDHMKRLY